MATDPVPALLALVKDRPDPRTASNWISAYLGKRAAPDRRRALAMLQSEFKARLAAEPRAATLILRVLEKIIAGER
ncbi:MAG: hypothetical protein ACXWML_12275 [Candidatus Binataceae bacterium]